MPKSAAEKFARAVERVRDGRLSPDEHEVAVADMLAAHSELLEKQGVETSSQRTIGQFIAGALLIAVVVSMVLNFGYAVTAHNTANTAKSTSRQARTTAREVRVLQQATVLNQRKGCERSNDAREGEVKNLRSDAAVEQAQLDLWAAALAEATPAELEALEGTEAGDALNDNIQTLERGVEHKKHAIAHLIASQATVAEHKGSPRADCKAAYPLNKPAALILRSHAGVPGASELLAPGLLELVSASR